MKGILIFLPLVCMVTMINAQSGFSLSYATEKVWSFDFFYGKGDNRFHAGFSSQGSDRKDTVVSKRKPNYGLTQIGNGDFFWSFDMGYGKVILQKITLQGELNIGQKEFYTNYQDNRFKDGGYTLVNDTKLVTGIGANLGYIATDYIEAFIGYNTLKRMAFGLRVVL